MAKADLRHVQVLSEGIWGVWHSHPISEANPSDADIACGPRYGHALIYDVIGDEFRLWRIQRSKWYLEQSFDFDRSWLFFVDD